MESIFLLVILLAVLVLPSFLLQRRQKRRLDEIRAIQESVAPGDKIVTTAGLHATVLAVTGETVTLEISPGVVSTWEKFAVVQNLSRAIGAVRESEAAPSVEDRHPENNDQP